MRYWIYRLLLWLTFPLWLYYSYRRCRQSDLVRGCWRELWGFRLPKLSAGGVWVHAVSLGEAQVALHLMRQLRQQYPQLPLFFTAGNRSALAVVTQAQDFVSLPQVATSYLPLDYAWIRQRLFSAIQPSLLVLIETELWPNLLMTAHQRHIPIAMIQARVSRRSKEFYPRYMQPLLGQLLSPVKLLAAQTEEDRQFFVAMGANATNCVCLGNLKYDLPLAVNKLVDVLPRLLSDLQDRWVWCAGSTHQGEEIPVLTAHQQVRQTLPHALLILAPRHLRHLDVVKGQIEAHGLRWVLWSEWVQDKARVADVGVILVDQLGVLVMAYQLAQACFVGGSLVPWGGHNMLEPAALRKPIVTGEHNHNFAEIAQVLGQANALQVVDNAQALAHTLVTWSANPEAAMQMGESAYGVFLSQQGATSRVLTAISPWIASQWQVQDHTAH